MKKLFAIISIGVIFITTVAFAQINFNNQTIEIDANGNMSTGAITSTEKINTVEPSPDLILGFYNFNSTTTKDVSGYNFTGTEFGAPTLSGNKLSLNGSSAIDLSTHLYNWSGEEQFTFSARVTTSATSGTLGIIAFSDSQVAATHALLFINSSGYPVWQIVDNAVFAFRWVYEVDIRDGSEHYLTATCGPNGNALYVDNVLVTNLDSGNASATTSPANIRLTDANIGRCTNNTGPIYYYTGEIDDIVFMNRQVSATDVDYIYNHDLYGFEVLILAGQSNMQGVAPCRGGLDDDYTKVAGKVYQYGCDSLTVTDATNPLDHCGATGTCGMWLWFCNQWVDDIQYGRGIMLVPCAQGGTSFLQWSPGGTRYTSMVTNTNAAMGLSDLNRFAAILWHQGESDAQSSGLYLLYYDNENRMHTALKSDLNGGIFNDFTPFISGAILKTVPDNPSTVNASLKRFAESIPGAKYYDNGISDSTGVDSLHYTAAQLQTIGEGYYEAFKLVNSTIRDIITVNSILDLPQPIGGVIYLAPNTLYRVATGVELTISDIIEFDTNSAIENATITTDSTIRTKSGTCFSIENSQITYTGAGTLFTSANLGGDCLFQGLTVIISGSGSIFSITSTAIPPPVFFMDTCTFAGGNLGSISSIQNVWRVVQFVQFSQGLTLTNTRGFGYYTGIMYGTNQTTTFFDFQGASHDLIQFQNVNPIINTNETLFDFNTATYVSGVAVGGGVISFIGTADDSNLFASGSGTQASLGFKFLGNVNIPDSTAAGNVYFQGNTTDTIIDTVQVPVRVDAIYLEGDLERFENTNKRITYIGLEPYEVRAIATVILEPAIGTNQTIGSYIAKTEAALFNVTFTNGTNIVNRVGHGLSNGTSIRFSTTGTLPAEIRDDQFYWVINTATDTFQVSDTEGGGIFSFTDDGTGTHSYSLGEYIERSEVLTTTSVGASRPSTIQALVKLRTGDFLEVFVDNHTSANDVTVTGLNLIVK